MGSWPHTRHSSLFRDTPSRCGLQYYNWYPSLHTKYLRRTWCVDNLHRNKQKNKQTAWFIYRLSSLWAYRVMVRGFYGSTHRTYQHVVDNDALSMVCCQIIICKAWTWIDLDILGQVRWQWPQHKTTSLV